MLKTVRILFSMELLKQKKMQHTYTSNMTNLLCTRLKAHKVVQVIWKMRSETRSRKMLINTRFSKVKKSKPDYLEIAVETQSWYIYWFMLRLNRLNK